LSLPSPVSGLGEHKVESGSDSFTGKKGKPQNSIHPEGTSFSRGFRCSPPNCRFPQTTSPEPAPQIGTTGDVQLRARHIARRRKRSSRHSSRRPKMNELAMTHAGHQLPVAITPYFASLLDRNNPLQPIRRTVLPTTGEHLSSPGEAVDPSCRRP